MKRLRSILTVLVIVGLIAVAAYYSMAPRPILVETVEVRRGPFRVSFVEEGKTRVSDRYIVSAPVAGVLRRIRFDVGDQIRRGQALARIDPPPAAALDPRSRAQLQARLVVAEATLQKAKEDVETARTDVRYWETELPRIRDGVELGLTARERLDKALSDERAAKARLRAAEQQVEVARSEAESVKVELRYASAALDEDAATGPVTVASPVAGRVLEVRQESETVVQASQPLVAIADPEGLEVEAEVLSSDAVRVREGMRVLLERWGGDGPLEAVVRRVEPVAFTKVSALGVEEQRVLVIIDIASPREEWRNLGDQYRVEARFILDEANDVLQIPTSALFRQGDGWAVFLAGDEIATMRPVEVGRRSGLQAEILSGLDAGDAVVNHPSDTLTDGAPIERP